MAKIVLSYRRDDSGTVTNWLTEKLVERYGREAIFRDIDSIQPTENFRKRIGRALRDCDFVVAIIGPGWQGRDGDGRGRINADNDWVRVEVETALQLDIPLLPVLVEGAEMPQPDELPASLREMTEINALPISSASSRFYDDLERLYAAIEKVTGVTPDGAAGPVAAAPQPAAAVAAPQPAVAAPQQAAAVPEPAPAPPPQPAPPAPAPSAAPASPGQADGAERAGRTVRQGADRLLAFTDRRSTLFFIIVPSLVMAVFWWLAFMTEGYGNNDTFVFSVSTVFMVGLGMVMRIRGGKRAIHSLIVGGIVGAVTLLAAMSSGQINIDREFTPAFSALVGGGLILTYFGFVLGRFVRKK